MNLLKIFDGKKSYLAALGLFGLGLTRLAAGDVLGAAHSLLEAAAVAGLRAGISAQGAGAGEQKTQDSENGPKA